MRVSNRRGLVALGICLIAVGMGGQLLGLFGPMLTFGPLGFGVVLLVAGLVARKRDA